jgi:hypothetical protein
MISWVPFLDLELGYILNDSIGDPSVTFDMKQCGEFASLGLLWYICRSDQRKRKDNAESLPDLPERPHFRA